MNPKKKRNKNRRRARKLAEQAWEAADDNNLDLAVKIIRRAVEFDPGNPVLWNDQGMLLLRLNDDDQAADAFQAAISLAPDFAEAYAHLAQVRVREGNVSQAVVLQREAVKNKPESERHQKQLAAFKALSGLHSNSILPLSAKAATQGDSDECDVERALKSEYPDLATRVRNLDWLAIEESLTRKGYTRLRALLSAEHCNSLRMMFDDDTLFSQTVKMNKSRFGKGVYRYFGSPLPRLVDAIRRVFYPHVSKIANVWQRLLEEDEQYPPDWEEFRIRCAEAGQSAPTPLLLRYETGGFNAPHQDIRGDVYFPLQLVIIVSPLADPSDTDEVGFTGGEFLFCDQPERKKTDRCRIPAGLGDAVLFCTRARLVHIGGVYGLKPVKHGMDRLQSGIRYALGVPFHEYF